MSEASLGNLVIDNNALHHQSVDRRGEGLTVFDSGQVALFKELVREAKASRAAPEEPRTAGARAWPHLPWRMT